MYELTKNDIQAVSGGGVSEEQNTGYVFGYAIGFLGRAAKLTFGGGGGYRLGIAAYNVIHRLD